MFIIYLHLEETYNTIFNISDNNYYNFYENIIANSFQHVHNYYKYFLMTCHGIFKSKGFTIL